MPEENIKKNIKLSIVTLHTNDALILQTLDSIYKTVRTPFEYILVDNNRNKERLQKIKEQFPKIKLVQNPKNYGYARGINNGFKHATGEFVLALNPDILVFDDTVDDMVSYMEKNKEIAVLGPRLLNADKTLQYSCRRYPNIQTMLFRRGPLKGLATNAVAAYEMQDFDHNETIEVDWLCGGFLMMQKKAFEKIGYFDEFYFLYFDDVDFCRRAKRLGKVVYFPKVTAIHSASYESKKKIIPFFIHVRSMCYYFLKFLFFPNLYLEKWSGWHKK